MLQKKDLQDIISLVSDIKHGKVFTSYSLALKTEELLKNLISNRKWDNAQDLMRLIKMRIKYVNEALPQEIIPTNIMRHILKVIREEYENSSLQKGTGQSLHQLVTANPNSTLDYSESLSDLKISLLDHLAEYKVELETSTENIANQASEHIHTNEVILTVGKSSIVENFLKSAAKTRKFQVIIVEAAPLCYGHELAMNLAKNNIPATVITDSAAFAMMWRVNKVIVGAQMIMANGGLRAASGVHGIALAAKYCSVPVIVLANMYKLTPVYMESHEQNTFNICTSPADVIKYSSGPVLDNITICSPLYDYVPPELITLFISHQGGNAPSYMYRLLSELYHQDDHM